jgi:SAM-dependent methyltransferase
VEIAALLKEKGGIRLDIACGATKQPGFVGMDMLPLENVDVVHDVLNFPWPLPDECALVAVASHIIEHIPAVARENGRTWLPFMRFMDECWRVLKYDAQIAISYPHGDSQGFLQDPTHCHAMNEAVWVYFDPLESNTAGRMYQLYRPKPWKIETLSWVPTDNVEVILRKRREDPSYYV